MKSRPRMLWLLTVLLVLIATISQMVSYWQTRDILASTIRERELDKVHTIGSLLERLIAETSTRISLAATLLKHHEALADAVAQSGAEDRTTLGRVLDQLFVESKMDLLEVTDDHGIVLYRAHVRAQKGERNTSWGVAEALGGLSTLSTTAGPSGLAIHAIEPLNAGGRIVGTVMVGIRLNEMFMQHLSQAVGAELALLGRTKPIALSHATMAPQLDPKATDEAFHQKIPLYHHNTHTHFTTLYLPMLIVDEGFVVAARISSATAYTLLDQRTWHAAQFAVLMLALSIVLGIVVLRWLLTPLRALRRRAEQSAIEITGEQIAGQSSDEITSVVYVLDVLTTRLITRNAELAAARNAAEAASTAKSEFLSTMSHEIRTPLNGVLGMVELLARTPLDATQHTYCEAIRTSGHTLYTLLSDILDLAKIEAGKVELEHLGFAPGTLCKSVMEAYRGLAAERSTVLVLELDPALPAFATGDPTRLRQVLGNLLGNAVKFTQGGVITVSVRPSPPRAGDDRTWWQYAVRDTGIGMAPEVVSKLFQPFTQADSSTTRQYGGTGLGLAICRTLVEMMGGTLEVTSAPDVGSTFCFTLPLAAASEAEAESVSVVLQPCAARVLVAEDNDVNQLMIQAMLDLIGASSHVVANGAEAIAALQREPFDIVLMDCQMPVMDGFEATRQIRALEMDGRRTPILALTANALSSDGQRCLEVGMDDYLTKPIPLEALSMALARWAPTTVISCAPEAVVAVAAAPVPCGPETGALPGVLVRGLPAPITSPMTLTSSTHDVPQSRTTPPPAARSAQAGAHPSPLDRTPIEALRALQRPGGPDILGKVLQTYLTSTPRLLATLRQAFTAGDTNAVHTTAHSLKSSSAQVGAMTLAAHCQTLETQCRAQTLEQVSAVLADIEEHYLVVQEALTFELDNTGSGPPWARAVG